MAECYPVAKAKIYGSHEYAYLHGEVYFFETKKGIKVKGKICNLPENKKGFYGFHLHEGKECEPQSGKNVFSKAEGHYNPEEKKHPLHAGDFPVIMATQNGFSEFCFVTDRICIGEIVGRALIVHLGADDFSSQPSGKSGKRIACGIITRL